MKWKPNKSSFCFVHELYFFITTKKPHCSLWSWTVKKEVLGSKRSFFFSCGLRPSLSSLSLPSASWLVASAAGSDAKCSAAVEPWARSRDNNQRSGKHGLNTAVTPGPLLPAPRSALQGANGAVQQEKRVLKHWKDVNGSGGLWAVQAWQRQSASTVLQKGAVCDPAQTPGSLAGSCW